MQVISQSLERGGGSRGTTCWMRFTSWLGGVLGEGNTYRKPGFSVPQLWVSCRCFPLNILKPMHCGAFWCLDSFLLIAHDRSNEKRRVHAPLVVLEFIPRSRPRSTCEVKTPPGILPSRRSRRADPVRARNSYMRWIRMVMVRSTSRTPGSRCCKVANK